MTPEQAGALPTRLWQKIITDGECWLWTAHADPHGYGKCRYKGTRWSAHRAFYDALVGPIPDGHELDHLCRVRNCVNPAHLEAVLPAVNKKRAGAAKTHCKRGHEYTPENTYRRPNKPTARVCRQCQPILLAASFARRRSA